MNKKIGYLALGILSNCLPMMAAIQPVSINSSEKSSKIEEIMQQGHVYFESGKLDSAMIYYDKAIELDSTYADGYVFKSNILKKIGQIEDALALNSKALSIAPSNKNAILNQSTIYMYMSRFDDALNTLDDALAKNSEEVAFYDYKADCYRSMKDTANVIATCNKILSLKNADYDDRFQAHSTIVRHSSKSKMDDAIKKMVKDFGASDYNVAAFATKIYNATSQYDKAEKYKKTAFKLHDKQKLENKVICIDKYVHSNVIVQACEYFNPQDAGRMKVQYEFRVYNSESYEWMYNVRVEYVTDIMGEYKSQMAVMATLSSDGFRTYWETLSELKSTSYEKWISFANQIIDNKLKVGSATIIGKDKEATITIGGDGEKEEEGK